MEMLCGRSAAIAAPCLFSPDLLCLQAGAWSGASASRRARREGGHGGRMAASATIRTDRTSSPSLHHSRSGPGHGCCLCFAGNGRLDWVLDRDKEEIRWTTYVPSALLAVSFAGTAHASSNKPPNVVYNQLATALEFGIQFLYLGGLLAFLGIGSFLVVRQVLIRRELEMAAKDLQERVRTGQASPEEYFELGAIMLRKKFFPLATKYLEQAIQKWDGDGQDLAQVYNALGFSYFSDGKFDKAILQYERAVKLQPGYVVAWNNLGDAYEKKKNFSAALQAYNEALLFDPSNKIARTCSDVLRKRVDRLKGVTIKPD